MNPELHWDADKGWNVHDLVWLWDNGIDIFHLAEVEDAG